MIFHDFSMEIHDFSSFHFFDFGTCIFGNTVVSLVEKALALNVKFTFGSFKIRCFLSVPVVSLVEDEFYFFDCGAGIFGDTVISLVQK